MIVSFLKDNAYILAQLHNLLFSIFGRNRLPLKKQVAGLRPQNSVADEKKGAFARAVVAQHGNALAGVNGQ